MGLLRLRRAACAALLFALVGGPKGGRCRGVEAATRKSEEERRAEYERFVDMMMDTMPAEDLAEELVGVIHRTMDSERRERKRKELQRDFDTDDEALLERIGRLVVQWVNTRLTPRTDEECKWSWGRWRCDPQCACKYKYRFGDYAPGRSCRLRPEEERELSSCDPEAGNDVSLLEKFASFVGRAAKGTWRFTSEHVIPQTDKECRFSVARSLEERRPVCSPRKVCAFHYKFGDLHPGRSCRIRQPGNEYSKGAARARKEARSRSIGGGSDGNGGGGGGGGKGGSWSLFESSSSSSSSNNNKGTRDDNNDYRGYDYDDDYDDEEEDEDRDRGRDGDGKGYGGGGGGGGFFGYDSEEDSLL